MYYEVQTLNQMIPKNSNYKKYVYKPSSCKRKMYLNFNFNL